MVATEIFVALSGIVQRKKGCRKYKKGFGNSAVYLPNMGEMI